MNLLCLVFLSFLKTWLASALPFEIELFTELDCTGQSIKFLNNGQNDLECVRNVLCGNSTFHSRWATGWWAIADSGDETWGYQTFESTCLNWNSENLWEKIQPLGFNDTELPAIAIKPSLKSDDVFVSSKAAEAFVTGIGNGNRSTIFTTGFSNWTLFENNNFEGDSECLVTDGETSNFRTTLQSIGSVLRGCLDQYSSKMVSPIQPSTISVS